MNDQRGKPATAGDSQPADAPRAASLRSTLIWLVLACLLPGAVGSGAVLYIGYRSERAQLESGAVQTARALVQTVDAELSKARAAAQTLSKSAHLQTKNLDAFYAQAQDVLKTTGVGNNYVLTDSTGQQVLNTLRPFPGPLPRHGNPELLRRVFDTGQPIISDVFIGGVLRRPLMTIDVPVFLGGKVAYDLSITLLPERFGDLLHAQRLPPDWPVAIFDSQVVIAARSHAPEKFVGKPGAPGLIKALATTGEGIAEIVTVEGIAAAVVFSRSPLSNWTVAIGIPTETFAAELRQRFLLLAAAIAALLIVSVALASVLAERIARSIHALAAPALALGSGRAVTAPAVELREAAEVATAIGTASALLRQRAEALQRADQELQDFSYSVSHDLRTPLRAIAGYAQIVTEDCGGQIGDEGRRLLARISENTVRMGQLIDGLTDFMQISRRQLEPAQVDMRELAGDVFASLRAALPDERRLDLILGELPPAWGDRALLRLALEHLMANAIKFIPARTAGTITVDAETGAAETVYRVADNGAGFDMRYAAKLFHVFEHVHSPGEFEGIGIGLAIVKRIVNRHGGRVWANGRPGEGASFYFALPAMPPPG